jgi:hypothetical protein
MPTQEFFRDTANHSDTDSVRVTWDFGYQEVFLTYEGRTFQLHNASELRSTGVRIGTSVKDELFVHLGNTSDGERFHLSLNAKPLAGSTINFAASPSAATMNPTKVTAHVAPPATAKWKFQERVEKARLWCRAIAALLGLGVLYTAMNTSLPYNMNRREVMVSCAAVAVVLMVCDLLSKTDTGASVLMLVPPLAFLALILGVLVTYLKAGVPLIDPVSFLALGIILVLATAIQKCLSARSSAGKLRREARDHRRIVAPKRR